MDDKTNQKLTDGELESVSGGTGDMNDIFWQPTVEQITEVYKSREPKCVRCGTKLVSVAGSKCCPNCRAVYPKLAFPYRG